MPGLLTLSSSPCRYPITWHYLHKMPVVNTSIYSPESCAASTNDTFKVLLALERPTFVGVVAVSEGFHFTENYLSLLQTLL